MYRPNLHVNNSLALPKINSLFLAVLVLILVHISIHTILNEVIREGSLEHPDSVFYTAHAEALADRWRQGEIALVRYPEFANIEAAVFFIFNNNIQSIRFLNIMIHIITALVAYFTLKNITSNKYAPWLALFIVGLHPYQTYLSTQILKDSWLILGTAIVLYAATARTKTQYVIAGFIGVGILAFLRTEYAAIFLTILTPYIIWQVWRGKLAKLMMLGSGAIAIATVLFIFQLEITGGSVGLDTANMVAEKTALRSSTWTPGTPHIKFFSNRSLPAIQDPDCYKGNNLVNCSGKILESTLDAFFIPHPWNARTTVETAFALAQVWWYILLFLFTLSLISTRTRTTLLLLLLFIAITLPLGLGIQKISAYLRWRSPPDYILMLAMSLSIVNLIYYKNIKRILDIFMSIVILLIMSPVMILIAWILFTSGQPIIFKQVRVGYKRKPITIYKFTTMVPDNENPDASAPPGMAEYTVGMRISKLGNILRPSALDELPQLWNVLKGDLSIVGPRALNRHLDVLCAELPNWSRRYDVMPGLVGLAAFNAGRLDNVERIKWDVEYVKTADIWLDLKLIVMGIKGNLTRKWK